MNNKTVNRRSFIKSAGTGTAGVVAVTTIVKRAMASLGPEAGPPITISRTGIRS